MGMLLFFPLMLMLTARLMDHTFDTLPWYNLSEGLPTAVFSQAEGRRVSFPVLTGHDGKMMSSADLKGKIYLAFFFSVRSEYLAKITARLRFATYKYPKEEDIVYVCFNTEFDSLIVPEIRNYMRDAKAPEGKWFFLNGPEEVLDSLYQEVFLIKDYSESSNIWLVDAEGYFRGKYNANREQEIERAMEDIALLKKEQRVAAAKVRKGAKK
jgi:cytochrome oxidase Cu insertion factor (SCO1/SenC/PrrC family)